MRWLGSDDLQEQELVLDDTMRGCTELLILTARDFLEDTPMGSLQRQAMEANALHVEHMCCKTMRALGREPIDNHVYTNIRFFYYLKSLAEMIASAAQGLEADDACKKVFHEHIHVISEMLDEDDRINDGYIEDSLSLLLLKLVAII